MSTNGNGRREAVICEPLRTPVGRFGGVFRDVDAATLAVDRDRRARLAHRACAARTSTTWCSGSATRTARRRRSAGSPRSTPGCRWRCPAFRSTGAAARPCRPSSTAACSVQTGAAELVLAGGVESMSQAEFYSTSMRWGARMGAVDARGPADARARHGRRREPSGARRDARNGREPAARVRDRARGAGRAGPALPPARGGRAGGRSLRAGDRARDGAERRQEEIVDRDEHPRADASLEALGRCAP